MTCVLKEYKLAWMQGNYLHSSMHDTMAQAVAASRQVNGAHMIMRLTDHQGESYTWQLMPGHYAWVAQHHRILAVVLIILLVWLVAK